MNKRLLAVLVLILIVVASAVGAVVIHGSAQAQPIPANAHFKDVKRLSVGKKPACLPNVVSAQKAVAAAASMEFGYSYDMALGTRIIDMPAGNFDTTVNTFAHNQATGTSTFNDENQQKVVGDLQTFNYTAIVNPVNNHWKLTRMIACKK